MVNNLKVSVKLSLGFGIILVLMVILGIFSLQRMSVVNDQSTIIAANWMPSIKVVEEINTDTSDLRITEFKHVLTQTPEAMLEVENEMESIFKELKKDRDDYEKLISSPEEKALYDEFSKKFEAYMQTHNKLIAISRQNKTEEAMDLLREGSDLFNNYSAVLLKLVDINVAGGNQASTNGDVIYADSQTIVIILIVTAILLGVGLSFIIINDITKKLDIFKTGLLGFFSYLNKETTKVELITINTRDEFGQMAETVNENIKKTELLINQDNGVIADVHRVVNEVKAGRLNQRITKDTHNESLQQLKNTFNEMLDNTSKNVCEDINKITRVLNSFAKLNFTDRIENDVGGVAKGLNNLAEIINQMLVENKSNGLTLDESSNILLANVDKLNQSSNEAAASLEETAAALEEMTSNIRNNTENILKMATLANGVTESANKGERLANQTTVAMEEINAQVTAINDAIAVIDQIAFQTNILSLNAAVEAATAGEAGKGFAVVAGEVRNLASRSAEAAKEIKDIVERATSKANEGKSIANDMIQGYSELNKNISHTINLISDIEHASKEQLLGIEQINDAVTQLDQQTQQNAMVASQTHDVAVLTDEIAKLVVAHADEKEFIGKYEVKGQKVNNPTKDIHIKVPPIKKISSMKPKTVQKIAKEPIKTVTTNQKAPDGEWENF
ncbi:MAG: methyl-accepting chemotaxis protein [Arcobacteraceae bacterium]